MISEVIYDYDDTSLKYLPIFGSFVKLAKPIYQTELVTMVGMYRFPNKIL